MGLRKIDLSELMNSEFALTLRRMREIGDPRLSMTLRVAWGDGWPKPVLAELLGVTRQAVQTRVRSAKFVEVELLPPIPPPPKRPPPIPRPQKEKVLIEPELAVHMRELYRQARTVNGAMSVTHPARRASEELSETMASLIERRVGKAQIARVLGCTIPAVSLRLARHGYPAPNSYVRRSPLYRNTTTHESRRIY